MFSSKANDYVLCEGHILDPANDISKEANLFVKDGLISEISNKRPGSKLKQIDCSGKYVVPGFIDLHTHLRDPGFTEKEDIETGSKAALAGGYTTIFCMPNTNPVNDNLKTLKYIQKKTKKTQVKIHPVAAISKGSNGEELADIEEMAKRGVIAISDDGKTTKNGEVLRLAMLKAKEFDLLVMVHAEIATKEDDGKVNLGIASKLGIPGIHPASEEAIIERDICIAKQTEARLHICHVSTAKGIDLIRNAKNDGLNVTCEVTPHHILLNEEAVEKYGPNAIMKPPLRTEEDRLALIDAINDGTVDAIATDHAPHLGINPSLEGRGKGRVNLINSPFGIIGLETAFPVCMKLVEEGKITLERLIELLTSGPARVAKLKAGSFTKGYPADITIFDPNETYIIDSSKFKSKSRNTPFEGWDVRGKIRGQPLL